MKQKKLLALTTWVLPVFLAVPLFADKIQTFPISKGGLDNIHGVCSGSGDLYLPPGVNGVYGCIKGNGNSVFCGGVGKYANTCTTSTQKLVVKKGQTVTQADLEAAAAKTPPSKEKTTKNAKSVQEFLKQR
jgi:hypothetical protein